MARKQIKIETPSRSNLSFKGIRSLKLFMKISYKTYKNNLKNFSKMTAKCAFSWGLKEHTNLDFYFFLDWAEGFFSKMCVKI